MESDKRGTEGFATTVLGSGMVQNKSFQEDSITVFLCLERHKLTAKKVPSYYLSTQKVNLTTEEYFPPSDNNKLTT